MTKLQYSRDNSGPTLHPPTKKRRKEKKKAKRKTIEDFQRTIYKTSNGYTTSPPPGSLHYLGPPAPSAISGDEESLNLMLKDMDWLNGGSRNVTTEGGNILANLPKLQSKQRKKNRGIRNKKKAKQLSADVVALQ
eukprot:CAMPEP_0118647278 /NCGR_PEP_ID=MMETSP0785-20121206/8519_1 /TAXON_ID=91992 /ORGANISM="Bolidomonas pacifica, Strain CCMP 1866" /LENGTH=134 /DNA_ID=CAMNT_0006539357 /DNA_START=400 /DNA_END=801 /DNA_ORIENTATION=+